MAVLAVFLVAEVRFSSRSAHNTYKTPIHGACNNSGNFGCRLMYRLQAFSSGGDKLTRRVASCPDALYKANFSFDWLNCKASLLPKSLTGSADQGMCTNGALWLPWSRCCRSFLWAVTSKGKIKQHASGIYLLLTAKDKHLYRFGSQ